MNYYIKQPIAEEAIDIYDFLCQLVNWSCLKIKDALANWKGWTKHSS